MIYPEFVNALARDILYDIERGMFSSTNDVDTHINEHVDVYVNQELTTNDVLEVLDREERRFRGVEIDVGVLPKVENEWRTLGTRGFCDSLAAAVCCEVLERLVYIELKNDNPEWRKAFDADDKA